MQVNMENYESLIVKIRQKWVRLKNEPTDRSPDADIDYKENQVLNILGRFNCIEKSLK